MPAIPPGVPPKIDTTNQNIYIKGYCSHLAMGSQCTGTPPPPLPPPSAKTTFAERHTSGSPSTSIGLAPPPPPTHSIKEHRASTRLPRCLHKRLRWPRPPLAAPTTSRAYRCRAIRAVSRRSSISRCRSAASPLAFSAYDGV